MFPHVDTKDASAVEHEVQKAYLELFPGGDAGFVPKAFGWVKDSFGGRHPGFLANDARYHDLEHTLQGTLCMARLLVGRHRAAAKPALHQRQFELALLAILFHDTGYLRRTDDSGGTGAKYTFTHVTRSVQFAELFLEGKGIPLPEIRSVQNLIRCTGVNVDLGRIPFTSELERILGFCLGTADLLGQMAAPDYVEKLPVLFTEFDESVKFYEGRMAIPTRYANAQELLNRTPEFWEHYVLPKLTNDFWAVFKYLNDPWPGGPNEYLRHVEDNILKVRRQLTA